MSNAYTQWPAQITLAELASRRARAASAVSSCSASVSRGDVGRGVDIAADNARGSAQAAIINSVQQVHLQRLLRRVARSPRFAAKWAESL